MGRDVDFPIPLEGPVNGCNDATGKWKNQGEPIVETVLNPTNQLTTKNMHVRRWQFPLEKHLQTLERSWVKLGGDT